MAKKSIYNNVSREKKSNAKSICIVLGVILALLVIFIAWCAFAFSDSAGYENTAETVTTLKLEIERKDFEIGDLKEKVVKLEQQKKQLELDNAQLKEQVKQDSADEQTQTSVQTEKNAQ